MSRVVVLLPVDLYHDTKLLKAAKVFLVEEEHYFNRSAKCHGSMKLNILKPIYHRATMRAYYDFLKSKNIDCDYIDGKSDWVKIVKAHVDKTQSQLIFYDPVDRYVEARIKSSFTAYNFVDTPRFVLSRDDLANYSGAMRQTSFYGWARKTTDVLMVGANPFGGKLTYDGENRKSPYDGIEEDADDGTEHANKYITDAVKYMRGFDLGDFRIWRGAGTRVKDGLGSDEAGLRTHLTLKFPVDRTGSLARLRYFIKHNLFRFGDFQDVIITNEENSFVFHSALSPMLNVGLLTPREVMEAVLAYFNNLSASKKLKSIHNVEGYIRQILGWREFSRYMYYHSRKYLNKNYFDARKRLNDTWYAGTTGIEPVDLCIRKAFKFGYLHHIERLMVVANYMTLTGISPTQMYRWFTEFSLDSYDWVMEYNIYCMASYSDGGQFTSKPYISTSRYILKMSNFASHQPWADKWDAMFWEFLTKHKSKIKKIGRLATLLKYVGSK
jgi:deoxyribodipyrimidine photolyase-related protein